MKKIQRKEYVSKVYSLYNDLCFEATDIEGAFL